MTFFLPCTRFCCKDVLLNTHVSLLQQMRRTGNKDENKRILMDLDVVLKSHDCPYIIQCYGAIVTNVSCLVFVTERKSGLLSELTGCVSV